MNTNKKKTKENKLKKYYTMISKVWKLRQGAHKDVQLTTLSG
jgi:hypothetical protein